MTSEGVGSMVILVCKEWSSHTSCPAEVKEGIASIVEWNESGMKSVRAIMELPSKSMTAYQQLFFAYESGDVYPLLLTCWNAAVIDKFDFVQAALPKLYPLICSDAVPGDSKAVPVLWSIMEHEYRNGADLPARDTGKGITAGEAFRAITEDIHVNVIVLQILDVPSSWSMFRNDTIGGAAKELLEHLLKLKEAADKVGDGATSKKSADLASRLEVAIRS
jgi:hypothetical protein